MSKHIATAQLAELAQIAREPRQHTLVDRTFGLPTELFALTVAAYVAFLGVMTAAFGEAGLVIPMAICVIYLVMAFGVPALWTQIGPDDGARRLSWSAFRARGVMTNSGPVSAGAAAAQVLILPLVILFWGIAIAVIASSRAGSSNWIPREPMRAIRPSLSSLVSWRLTVSMVTPSNPAISPRVSGMS
jgi:hypothetical protein